MVAVVYRTEVLFHIRYDALRQFAGKGVDARTEREETEDEIVLTLRIPKQRRKEA